MAGLFGISGLDWLGLLPGRAGEVFANEAAMFGNMEGEH